MLLKRMAFRVNTFSFGSLSHSSLGLFTKAGLPQFQTDAFIPGTADAEACDSGVHLLTNGKRPEVSWPVNPSQFGRFLGTLRQVSFVRQAGAKTLHDKTLVRKGLIPMESCFSMTSRDT